MKKAFAILSLILIIGIIVGYCDLRGRISAHSSVIQEHGTDIQTIFGVARTHNDVISYHHDFITNMILFGMIPPSEELEPEEFNLEPENEDSIHNI